MGACAHKMPSMSTARAVHSMRAGSTLSARAGTSPASTTPSGPLRARRTGSQAPVSTSTGAFGRARAIDARPAEKDVARRTQFPLAVPAGVDYPLAIAVTNATATAHFRAQVRRPLRAYYRAQLTHAG
jgi:hypothetical protein